MFTHFQYSSPQRPTANILQSSSSQQSLYRSWERESRVKGLIIYILEVKWSAGVQRRPHILGHHLASHLFLLLVFLKWHSGISELFEATCLWVAPPQIISLSTLEPLAGWGWSWLLPGPCSSTWLLVCFKHCWRHGLKEFSIGRSS